MELTQEEKQVLINIISNSKFTPTEWEQVVKNIVVKLQWKKPVEKVKEEKKNA